MPMQHYSLNGLRMFEAAARHLSFTAAANELNVSQAAVSQQIRRFEDALGVKLFLREKGGLSLSVSGQDLAGNANTSLSIIHKSIVRITNTETEGVLTISTSASFASRWLIPRLSKFQEKYPDIELHIHTTAAKVEFARDGIDAAIRYGSSREAGLHYDQILQDSFCLVTSPDIANHVADKVENLYNYPFIIDDCWSASKDNADLPGDANERAMDLLKLDRMKLDLLVYQQSNSVILAALAGKGIALTSMSLCSDDLETGKLALVCDFLMPLGFGYTLVCPEGRVEDPKLRAFKAWILQEIAHQPNG